MWLSARSPLSPLPSRDSKAMKYLVGILLLSVGLGAQQPPTAPVSWTVNLFNAASQAPAGTIVYRLSTDVVCGVDKAGRATGITTNPHEIRWDDWRDSTKDCLGSFSITSLADGQYYADVFSTDANSVNSKPPTRSNTFTVQTAQTPPPTPPPTTTGPAPVGSPLIR